jgi:amidase
MGEAGGTEGAAAMAARVRAGEARAADLVETARAAIAATDAELHGRIEWVADAPARARAIDARPATGVLAGVPVTVKDWIDVAGTPSWGGSVRDAPRTPDRDAPVVARLRAAGAVVVAKTRAGCDGDAHPPPRNPFAPDHTAGSSSGGEAALIGAGAVPLGVGSDSGGSLRWPAHCCGIAALRPTPGRVPLTGHDPPVIALSDPRTVIGPLAARVDDLALALTVLAGPHGSDASALPVPLDPGAGLDRGAAGARVACFEGFDRARPDAPTRAALRAAADALADAGAVVLAARPPRIEAAMAITRAYWARPESMDAERWRPWGPSTLDADAVERSLFEWDRLRRGFSAFLADHDLMLCPVAATAAPARDTVTAEDFAFTVPFSLTACPVAIVRAGTSPDGLPIGVQIAAAPFAEGAALAAARIVETALGPWPPPAGGGIGHS